MQREAQYRERKRAKMNLGETKKERKIEYGKEYEINPEGYIVYDCSGWCGLNFGAAERWFQRYDEAIAYAIELIKENADGFKRRVDRDEVIVYEGSEQNVHCSHNVPNGEVVFYWRNFK